MKNQYKWDFGTLEVAVCYLATYLAETMEIDWSTVIDLGRLLILIYVVLLFFLALSSHFSSIGASMQ